MIQTACLWI